MKYMNGRLFRIPFDNFLFIYFVNLFCGADFKLFWNSRYLVSNSYINVFILQYFFPGISSLVKNIFLVDDGQNIRPYI